MQVLGAAIIFLASISFVLCVERCNEVESKNISVLLPAWERAFSRKRRFILLPKGSTLKFTVFVSKAFLALYPKGFNFILEAAFYYPGPSTRLDLIPKQLRPTTPAPKPVGPTSPIIVCIPGSLICYKGHPAIKPAKVQRIDDNINNLYTVNETKNYLKHTNPNYWTKYNKFGDRNMFEQKYAWTPAKSKWQHKVYPQVNWQKWSTPIPSKSSWTRWHRAADENITPEFAEYIHVEFPDLEPFADWKHYHTHRDRRQLYHNFEGFTKILGFDMKVCILRTICDAKQFLLPQGYSLIHDILRVLFTFPTLSGMVDDYSRIMQADYETCDKELISKCPINFLNWFTNISASPHNI